MSIKLVSFFQYIYQYFRISYYFWLCMVKGGVIYSLYPSVIALIFTIKTFIKDPDEDIKELFYSSYNQYRHYQKTSFTYALLLKSPLFIDLFDRVLRFAINPFIYDNLYVFTSYDPAFVYVQHHLCRNKIIQP